MSEEMISAACPSCSKALLAPHRLAGRWIKCPRCAETLQLPGLDTVDALPDDEDGQEPLPLPEPDSLDSFSGAALAASPVSAPAQHWASPARPRRKNDSHKIMWLVTGVILAAGSIFFLNPFSVTRNDVVGDWASDSTSSRQSSGGAILSLNSDDTFTYSAESRRFSGQWSISGHTIALTVQQSNGSSPGVGDEAKWRVVQLSGPDMVLRGDGLQIGSQAVFHRR